MKIVFTSNNCCINVLLLFYYPSKDGIKPKLYLSAMREGVTSCGIAGNHSCGPWSNRIEFSLNGLVNPWLSGVVGPVSPVLTRLLVVLVQ